MAAEKGFKMGNHGDPGNPCLVLLILASAVLFGVLLVFNTMAGNPSLSHGLFIHGIGNVSAMYPLQITPAGWAFSIWGVIYLFEAIWIVYAVSNICRTVDSSPAYVTPAVLTSAFFLMCILNSASNIAWLFLWDRELILAAVPVLVITAATCQAGVLMGYINLGRNTAEMIRQGRLAEITFVRIFVFNGLGMYGAWTTIASVINLGTALAYMIHPPLPQGDTAVLCLSILAALFVIFLIIDLKVLEKYSRFTFSPYLVLLWAMAAVMSKNWDPTQASSIFTVVLTCMGAVGLLLKVVSTSWRQRHNSLVNYKLLQNERP